MVALGLSQDEGLTAPQLYALLGVLDQLLVNEMGELSEPIELLAVGGAAISLQWHRGRTTNDIDVVSDRLPRWLRAGAATVAAGQKGVRADWLNDAAKIGALSADVNPNPTLMFAGRNLCIYGAGARYVLAMKLVAGRLVDLQDMPILLEAAQFESLDEAFAWTAQAHSHHQIPVSAQYILEEAWDQHAARVSPRRRLSHDGGHLTVHPSDSGAGWDLVLKRSGAEPIDGRVLYRLGDALKAADFAQTVCDTPEPMRLGGLVDGAEYREPAAGGCRVVVLPVPHEGGWVLQVVGPGGERRAVSSPYPTQWQAQQTQSFLARSRAELGDPEGRRPVQVRVSTVCTCRKLGAVCLHFDSPDVDTHLPGPGRRGTYLGL